jgi:hypothetical protein
MSDLFTLDGTFDGSAVPAAPVLLCAVDSWIDAGLAAARARSELLGGCTVTPVGRFDTERLVDHQARRPVVHLDDGVCTGVDWPEIVLQLITDGDGRRALLLSGAEPDRSWRALGRILVPLARDAGVRRLVTLGAYPAPVPHSRPCGVVATASHRHLADRVGFIPGTMDVPAGFGSALERLFAEAGFEACGLWAQVPHYVANLPYPGAAVALLDRVRDLTGITVAAEELRRFAAETVTRLDELVAGNPEHAQMVAQLEAEHDQRTPTFPLPSGDELAAEVERFLRDRDT